MAQWKLDNYKIQREPLYPNKAEYIDAIVKGDVEAEIDYINKCLEVKEKYPNVLK